MTTPLDRLAYKWSKQAKLYRRAQEECEPSEDEYYLNKENADRLEKCAFELDHAISQLSLDDLKELSHGL